MITVIGGIETTVYIKMMPKKPRDFGQQNDVTEVKEEKTIGGNDATGFEQYYRRQMRAMEAEEYWSKVGQSSGGFGGYSAMDSDDSDIQVNISGCGYNVAKILGQKHKEGINEEVTLVSIVGGDALGLAAMNELQSAGVNCAGVTVENGATAVSVEMHNMMGDLEFRRKNYALFQKLDPEYIEAKREVIEAADTLFVDGKLAPETIDYIVKNFGDKKIFFDPASMDGAYNYQENDWKFHCVLPGRRESEAMTGLTVLGLDQLMAAGNFFEGKGVDYTIITLKGGGLYYKNGLDEGLVKPERVLQFATKSGAGDVVAANIVSALSAGCSLKEAGEKAIAAADAYLADVADDSVFTQLKKEGKC